MSISEQKLKSNRNRSRSEQHDQLRSEQTHAHAVHDLNCRRTSSNFAQGKRQKGESDLQLVTPTFEKMEPTQAN